jgi:Putative Ig domain
VAAFQVSAGVSGGTVGKTVLGVLTPTGAQGPVTYSIKSGSLAPGLTLNTATGVISGTPTSTTPSTAVLQATDGVNTATVTVATSARSPSPQLPGLSLSAIGKIPDNWSADWFAGLINGHLQYADVRNAISGSGIAIGTGLNGTAAATISLSAPASSAQVGFTLEQLTDVSVPSPVQGDILYYNGTAWVALPPGTAGQVLTTEGAGANPQWATAVSGSAQLRGATWSAANAALSSTLVQDVSVLVPSSGTIKRCTILTKGGTGSCEVDIWSAPIASYPPTVANSICPANHPIISSGVFHDDSTLTGFTTPISAGNVLTFHLVSSSTFTEIVITLVIQ